MNIGKLKNAEQIFLSRYPGGFSSPEMVEIGKKHKMEKMVELARTNFAPEKFDDTEYIVTKMTEIVSKSSMVSLFEKPKFRDYTKSLTNIEKKALAHSLKQLLLGNEEEGFESMVDILGEAKLAKWTLVTVYGAYYSPNKEVFVKPTTAKNVIKDFELEEIIYKPKPSYSFYKKYRDYINEMKTHISPSLSPSNAAFSGFLMISRP